MLLILLATLTAAPLCVPRTDVCAPKGSTLEGAITDNGGQVTLTPSRPLRALGAEFRAGTKVVVNVIPWWSSDKTSGAVVHVSGELTGEQELSGARVSGVVRLGQIQGRGEPPQLVVATELKGGQLKAAGAGTVEVGPGVSLRGNVEIGCVRLEVSSAQPIRALGLQFAAGTVRIEHRPTGTTLDGTLVRPQEVGGVWVEGQLYATLGAGAPRFFTGQLARATALKALGLAEGEAPAGTVVRAGPAATELVGSGPFTVCGVQLVPGSQQGLTFTTSAAPAQLAVSGTLVGRDVDLGEGLRMSGGVTQRFAPGGCQRLGLEGLLSRPAQVRGLRFAAATPLSTGQFDGEPVVRGTLAGPQVVEGLTVTGAVFVRAPLSGELRLLDGVLAKAAPFEAWQLPAGTKVQRFKEGWSFTAPKGQGAQALTPYRGERFDGVSEARSDASATTLTLVRPHTLEGTPLALNGLRIDHRTGCVLGGLATAQQLGIFQIPVGGSATVCGGALGAAEGIYAVPSLQVGRWFATHAISGTPGAPPAPQGHIGGATSARPGPGYWIQINSLCQGAAGIPLPPPPQRWIWVDLQGEPKSPAEAKELAARAAKRGEDCPVIPCCVP